MFIKSITLMLVTILIVSCENESSCDCENPLVDNEAVVYISNIIDGDTYEFDYNDEHFRMILIGCDAIEIINNSRLKDQANQLNIDNDSALALGNRALEFAKEQLFEKEVKIIRDPIEGNFDNFSRLLRRVQIGDSCFAEMLKVRGLALN
jgi:endonuclease YncB( thermonuclease family)